MQLGIFILFIKIENKVFVNFKIVVQQMHHRNRFIHHRSRACIPGGTLIKTLKNVCQQLNSFSKILFTFLLNILRDFKDPCKRRTLSFYNLLSVSNSMLSIAFIFLNM